MSDTKKLYKSIIFLFLFVIWTILVGVVDVKTVGPNGSSIGFAAINEFLHNLTGVHMSLYTITDWLGLVPVAVGFGFAILGLIQWIKRKNIRKVDFNILMLGVFYIITIAAYLFFEAVVINYRPVLINGFLEASYPSSTTLLVLCVMPTALLQFNIRIKSVAINGFLKILVRAFVVFMVIGRLVSGVHWATDIIGAILLSKGLVLFYDYIIKQK